MTRTEFVDFVRATFNAMDMITPAEGAVAVIKAFDELAASLPQAELQDGRPTGAEVKVVERLVIQDAFVEAENGDRLDLKYGDKVTTSLVRESDQTVMVFSRFWVRFPASIFAGERPIGGAVPASSPAETDK